MSSVGTEEHQRGSWVDGQDGGSISLPEVSMEWDTG